MVVVEINADGVVHLLPEVVVRIAQRRYMKNKNIEWGEAILLKPFPIFEVKDGKS